MNGRVRDSSARALAHASSCVTLRSWVPVSLPIVLSALLLAAQPQSSDSTGLRLQAIADSVVRARPRMPGILLHVESTHLNRRWSVAAGQSDTARDVPLRVDQPFRIASVTKTYTAAAVLRLVERGVIALSDPIGKHLPREFIAELERDNYRTDSITIEHLLSHRGGLDEHTAVRSYIPFSLANPAKHWTRIEQVRLLVDSLQPVGKPDERFRYSDTGYILLGAIIERHTGKNYGVSARELIGFEKLGLKHTWFETLEPAPAGVADRVHQYMNGVDTYGHDPSLDLYGGGGIATTIGDMSAFFTALLGGRVFEKKATLDTMMAVRPGFMDGYGLGLFRVNSGGVRGFGHSGFWGVAVVHFPTEGLTIAVSITEQSQGGQVFAIVGAILRSLRTEPR
jgi:D-alanyl-D-alanine carboxypeptidase